MTLPEMENKAVYQRLCYRLSVRLEVFFEEIKKVVPNAQLDTIKSDLKIASDNIQRGSYTGAHAFEQKDFLGKITNDMLNINGLPEELRQKISRSAFEHKFLLLGDKKTLISGNEYLKKSWEKSHQDIMDDKNFFSSVLENIEKRGEKLNLEKFGIKPQIVEVNGVKQAHYSKQDIDKVYKLLNDTIVLNKATIAGDYTNRLWAQPEFNQTMLDIRKDYSGALRELQTETGLERLNLSTNTSVSQPQNKQTLTLKSLLQKFIDRTPDEFVSGGIQKGDYIKLSPEYVVVKDQFVRGFIKEYNVSPFRRQTNAEGSKWYEEQVVKMIEQNRATPEAFNILSGKMQYNKTPEKHYSSKQLGEMGEFLYAAQRLTQRTGEDYLTAFASVQQIDYWLKDIKQDFSGALKNMRDQAGGGANTPSVLQQSVSGNTAFQNVSITSSNNAVTNMTNAISQGAKVLPQIQTGGLR
jgi:hypothetical protein